MAVCLFGFAACGDDDDDDNGGGGGGNSSSAGHLSINGKSYSLGYAYWFVDDYNESTGKYSYEVEFYNIDMMQALQNGGNITVPAGGCHSLFLNFDADGTDSEVPAGTYAPGTFEYTLQVGTSTSNPVGELYLCESADNVASLVITKDGNSYTVSLSGATFSVINNETSTMQGSFTYTGNLTEVPDGVHD